jgi:hypothetical protein
MRYKFITFIVLIVVCSLFTACSPDAKTAENSDPTNNPSVSAQNSPPSSAQPSPSASAQDAASMNTESSSPDNALDTVSLLVGSWINDELQQEMTFTSDGYYTAKNNGTSLGIIPYTAEATGSSSAAFMIEDTITDVVFTDENHLECDGVSYVRIFENEMVNSDAALKKLLVGSWETPDGCTSIFDADGTLTVKQPEKQDRFSSYTIEGLEETSMTMTITDADGTSNSLYVYFTDNNTLVMGEAVLTRVS